MRASRNPFSLFQVSESAVLKSVAFMCILISTFPSFLSFYKTLYDFFSCILDSLMGLKPLSFSSFDLMGYTQFLLPFRFSPKTFFPRSGLVDFSDIEALLS